MTASGPRRASRGCIAWSRLNGPHGGVITSTSGGESCKICPARRGWIGFFQSQPSDKSKEPMDLKPNPAASSAKRPGLKISMMVSFSSSLTVITSCSCFQWAPRRSNSGSSWSSSSPSSSISSTATLGANLAKFSAFTMKTSTSGVVTAGVGVMCPTSKSTWHDPSGLSTIFVVTHHAEVDLIAVHRHSCPQTLQEPLTHQQWNVSRNHMQPYPHFTASAWRWAPAPCGGRHLLIHCRTWIYEVWWPDPQCVDRVWKVQLCDVSASPLQPLLFRILCRLPQIQQGGLGGRLFQQHRIPHPHLEVIHGPLSHSQAGASALPPLADHRPSSCRRWFDQSIPLLSASWIHMDHHRFDLELFLSCRPHRTSLWSYRQAALNHELGIQSIWRKTSASWGPRAHGFATCQ